MAEGDLPPFQGALINYRISKVTECQKY